MFIIVMDVKLSHAHLKVLNFFRHVPLEAPYVVDNRLCEYYLVGSGNNKAASNATRVR